jgi:SAM-dependent methyltransferase
VQQLDPGHAEEFAAMEGCFDTVLCINVLEYLENPPAIVRAVRRTLKPGGVLVVLAPQGPSLFGALDRRLGHQRRYGSEEARALLQSEGFTVETSYQFNKAGTPPWWLYSRIFRSERINKPVLKLFDKTVWLWRRVDSLLPWQGLSLILIARNTEAPAASGELRRDGAVPQRLSSR